MLKVFKNKETQIRRVIEVDDAGNRIKAVCIIGSVSDLINAGIIELVEGKINKDNYLIVDPEGNVNEFKSYEEAKNYALNTERKVI